MEFEPTAGLKSALSVDMSDRGPPQFIGFVISVIILPSARRVPEDLQAGFEPPCQSAQTAIRLDRSADGLF
jgi:hypothetical protein